MSVSSGVYPVFENSFSIGTNGTSSVSTDMKSIAEMESFSLSIDGNVEEWTPFETEGWVKRMVTGKGLSISLSGKRCIGDAGNDYVAGLAYKTGQEAETKFLWTLPSGATLEFNCVVNVTNIGGGDSTNVAPLEFEVLSNGKPTYTP